MFFDLYLKFSQPRKRPTCIIMYTYLRIFSVVLIEKAPKKYSGKKKQKKERQ